MSAIESETNISIPTSGQPTHRSAQQPKKRAGGKRNSKAPKGARENKKDNPSPVVASQVSAETKQRILFRDLSDWLQQRKVAVAKCDEYIIESLSELGIEGHLVNKFHNPHAFSAACREAAMCSVLLREMRGKFKAKILDVFGSPRSMLIDPAVSGPFGDVVIDSKKCSSKAMKITWVASPATVVAGDAARGSFVRVDNCDNDFDVVVACDVYQCGRTAKQSFSPDFAKECILRSRAGVMYWIGRFFPGNAGADAPLKNGVIEQVFVKNEKGLILSSPDSDSGFYAPHPWPAWLEERSFEGLDISPVQKFGPYRVIRLAITPVGAIPIPSIAASMGDVGLMGIAKKSHLLGFLPYKSETDVNVHIPTFLTVGPKLVRKIPNGQLLDMAHVLVAKEFGKTPWLAELAKRHVEFYAELVDNTVLACIYHRRDHDSQRILETRQAHATSEYHLIQARGATNPETRLINLPALVGVLALIGITSVGVMRSQGACWMIPSSPLLSAIGEEALAYVSEPAACVGYLYEYATSAKREKPRSRLLFQVSLSAVRIGLGLPGRLLSLGFHLGWNFRFSSGVVRFRNFYNSFVLGELVEADQVVESIPLSTVLPSYTSRMVQGPEHFRGNIDIFVDGEKMSIEEAFESLGQPEGANVTYPVLITNRLLQQPANNESNLLAAVLSRIHNDPFVENPHDDSARHKNWLRLSAIVIEIFSFSLHTVSFTVADNIKLMGKKGKRLETAYNLDMIGGLQSVGKTINLKWNETISSQKEVGGLKTMKPRAIQNLPALLHAEMGGYARAFAHALHEIFDGKIHDVCGYPVAIFFASGYTQQQLSEIARLADSGVSVFAMSGDDSFVAWGGIEVGFGGEADQSKFDHTQDDGPMKHFMRPVLEAFGLPDTFIAQAYQACSSGYTLRRKRLFCKGYAGTQMPTGITTTTTFNSLSTLSMFVWYLYNKDRLSGLVEAGQELGFEVKYFPRDSVQTSTFLKGWWQKTSAGLQWFPLPSAVLKIGKLLNDPVKITGVTRRGKKFHYDERTAIRMCALALANSYGEVPRNYPILGEFLYTMKRLGLPSTKVLASLHESWKPRMSETDINRFDVLDSIQDRYNITPKEVYEVESLLKSIKSLPAYIEHPVFDKLCEVDY